MAVIALPASPGVMSIEWTLPDPPTQVNRSEWTGSQQVVILAQATRWLARLTWAPTYTAFEVRAMRGFLARLQGQANSFRLPACAQQHALTEPRADGGAARGDTSIDLDGMDAGEAYFEEGSLATIPLESGFYQLVIATAAMSANGSGEGTLAFLPALRGPVADNAALITRVPLVELSKVEDLSSYPAEPGGRHVFVLDCEEAY